MKRLKSIPLGIKIERYVPYPYHKTNEENMVESIFNSMSSIAGAWNKTDRLRKQGKRARVFFYNGLPFAKIGWKTFEVRNVVFCDGSY